MSMVESGPYRHGDDLVGSLRSAIHEESAAIAPQTSTLIEVARMAADEIEQLQAMLADAEAAMRLVRKCGNGGAKLSREASDYVRSWLIMAEEVRPIAQGRQSDLPTPR
jgi:IS5 family transposase